MEVYLRGQTSVALIELTGNAVLHVINTHLKAKGQIEALKMSTFFQIGKKSEDVVERPKYK